MSKESPIVSRAKAELDQNKALLRDVLKALSGKTLDLNLENLAWDFYKKKLPPDEKLYVHCALVGMMTVMVERIENEESPHDQA